MKKTAIFAGGCFWCVEHDLRGVNGVIDVISGYVGEGREPSYEDHTGFIEGVKLEYDDQKTSFKKIVQFFLDHIDPTDPDGQFYDRGESYIAAIFYKDKQEKNIAESLLKELEESGLYGDSIAVQVLEESKFWPAEEDHQKYAEKNLMSYKMYKIGSGRDSFQKMVCKLREQKKINWKN